MENFFKYWGPVSRTFPSVLKVHALGYYKAKQEIMDREFHTCNFSFLFQGSGTYRIGKEEYKIQAPSVLIQWPGPHFKYGPSPESPHNWEEFFIIYSTRFQETLKKMGFFTQNEPVYRLKNFGVIRSLIEKISMHCNEQRPELSADRIDRLCEQLLLETRVGPADESVMDSSIRNIHDILAERFNETIDLNLLARDHGFSPSTFRRLWKGSFQEPPWKFVLGRRIQRACSLLVETNCSIMEISQKVGFEDPLYFSKRFRKDMGLSPRLYRQRYKVDFPLEKKF